MRKPDLDPAIKTKIDVLSDRLAKETFFRDIAEIEQSATAIGGRIQARYDVALDARVAAYADAVASLERTLGWERLGDEQKDEVPARSRQCADRAWNNQTISHLRSVTDACDGRLATAVEKVHKILEGERVATVSIGNSSPAASRTTSSSIRRCRASATSSPACIGAGKIVIVR